MAVRNSSRFSFRMRSRPLICSTIARRSRAATGRRSTAKKDKKGRVIVKAGTFAVAFTDKKGKKKTEMWIVTANPAGPSLSFNTTGEKTMSVLQGQFFGGQNLGGVQAGIDQRVGYDDLGRGRAVRTIGGLLDL